MTTCVNIVYAIDVVLIALLAFLCFKAIKKYLKLKKEVEPQVEEA